MISIDRSEDYGRDLYVEVSPSAFRARGHKQQSWTLITYIQANMFRGKVQVSLWLVVEFYRVTLSVGGLESYITFPRGLQASTSSNPN